MSNSGLENVKSIIPKSKNTSPKKDEQPFIELDNDAMDIDSTEKKPTLITEKPNETHDSNDISEGSQDIKLVYTETNDADTTSKNKSPVSKKTPTKNDVTAVLSARTPRRVKLITISSPKRTKN